MENKVFRYALLTSLLIHVIILTQSSRSYTSPFNYALKSIEVTYFDLKAQAERARFLASKKESKDDLDRNTEVRLKRTPKTSSFVKDLSKLLGKFEPPKKQPATVAKDNVKRKVSVPALKTERINNPTYLNYYQVVRGEIKERTYMNYEQFDTGEVYLTFAISSDGTLKQIKLIEDRTNANSYLREISLKSVEEANPFPPFPKDLDYPELTFNVVISFEIED